MKTQNEIRSEFEKLEEIARIITCDDVKWCDVYHWYRTDNTDANSIYHLAWLNGAWYAFQEQQAKIDSIKNSLEDIYDLSDETNICLVLDKIKEILK